jgi:hypothetical protein
MPGSQRRFHTAIVSVSKFCHSKCTHFILDDPILKGNGACFACEDHLTSRADLDEMSSVLPASLLPVGRCGHDSGSFCCSSALQYHPESLSEPLRALSSTSPALYLGPQEVWKRPRHYNRLQEIILPKSYQLQVPSRRHFESGIFVLKCADALSCLRAF